MRHPHVRPLRRVQPSRQRFRPLPVPLDPGGGWSGRHRRRRTGRDHRQGRRTTRPQLRHEPVDPVERGLHPACGRIHRVVRPHENRLDDDEGRRRRGGSRRDPRTRRELRQLRPTAPASRGVRLRRSSQRSLPGSLQQLQRHGLVGEPTSVHRSRVESCRRRCGPILPAARAKLPNRPWTTPRRQADVRRVLRDQPRARPRRTSSAAPTELRSPRGRTIPRFSRTGLTGSTGLRTSHPPDRLASGATT